MNLLLNARDALEDADSPLIHLDIDEIELKAGELTQSSDARPGPFIRVRVTDNGAGMDGKIQRRVFDPFFTTKAVDKGTGLGLFTILRHCAATRGLGRVRQPARRADDLRGLSADYRASHRAENTTQQRRATARQRNGIDYR